MRNPASAQLKFGAIAALLACLLAGIGACNDDQPDTFIPCTDGVDSDGDGYGIGCPMGEDCDDTLAGIRDPCQADGCPTGWALVPRGAFEMGRDNTIFEEPAHEVTLTKDYCIQMTEVTVGAYRECVHAGQCDPPTHVTEDRGYYSSCNYTTEPGGREKHPVNCIGYLAAREYCQTWLAGDLPTEAEWEKAARGTDARRFPWGDTPEPNCTYANYDANGQYQEEACTRDDCGWGIGCGEVRVGDLFTWVAGSRYLGASPYGALDMAGNVSEWVLDCWVLGDYATCDASSTCTDPYTECAPGSAVHITRGGSGAEPWAGGLATYGREISAGADENPDGSNYVGFRCVKTLP